MDRVIESRVNSYISESDGLIVKKIYGELMEGKIPYPKFLEIMDSIGVKVSLDVYYFDDEYSEYSEDDPMNDDYN